MSTRTPNLQPRSQHHAYWGVFDTESDLPNAASNPLASPEFDKLEEGDIAYVRETRRQHTCRLTGAASGGDAIWLGEASTTSAPTDIYVDSSGGSDSNPGTAAEPVETIDAAMLLVPDVITKTVTLHFASGVYAAWTDTLNVVAKAPVVMIGDEDNIVASGTAQAGSSASTLVTSGGFTAEELVGMFVRITSGAAAGSIRNIKRNTTTDILPAEDFKAAVSGGDSFEVFTPAAQIEVADRIPLADDIGGGGLDFGGGSQGALFMVNLEFIPGSSVLSRLVMTRTTAYMFGVRWAGADSTGYYPDPFTYTYAGLIGGFAATDVPVTIGLVGDAADWSGWGVSLNPTPPRTFFFFRPALFAGILTSTSAVSLADPGRIRLTGGSIIVNDTPLVAREAGIDLDIRGGFIVHCADPAETDVIQIRGGAQCSIEDAIVEKVGLGTCIKAMSATSGQTGFPGQVTLDDAALVVEGIDDGSGNFPSDAVQVSGGALVQVTRGDPTVQGTFTQNVYVLRERNNGTIVEDAATLAVGTSLPSSGVTDGRFGWIRRV